MSSFVVHDFCESSRPGGRGMRSHDDIDKAGAVGPCGARYAPLARECCRGAWPDQDVSIADGFSFPTPYADRKRQNTIERWPDYRHHS